MEPLQKLEVLVRINGITDPGVSNPDHLVGGMEGGEMNDDVRILALRVLHSISAGGDPRALITRYELVRLAGAALSYEDLMDKYIGKSERVRGTLAHDRKHVREGTVDRWWSHAAEALIEAVDVD